MEQDPKIEFLENRIKEFPKTPLAAKLAGIYLNSGSNLSKAIFHCKNSILYYPEYLTPYLILCKCFLTANQFHNAYVTLKKVDYLFPNQKSIKLLFETLNQIKSKDTDVSSFERDDDSKFSNLEEAIDYSINAFDQILEKHRLSLIPEEELHREKQPEIIVESLKNPIIDLPVLTDEFLTIDDFEISKRDTKKYKILKISEEGEITEPNINEKNVIESLERDDILREMILEKDKASGKESSCDEEIISEIVTGQKDSIENKVEKDVLTIPDDKDQGYFTKEERDDVPSGLLKDKFDLIEEISKLNIDDDLKVSDLDIQEKSFQTFPEELEKVKKKDFPQNIVSRTLANIYESQGKFLEAIEVYKLLLQIKAIKVEEYERKIIELEFKFHESLSNQ